MTNNTQRVSELSFFPPTQRENKVADENNGASKHIDFSLFYFASADGGQSSEKYRLLIEGAKFADTHGFTAVWTPERHFYEFGGLYPNPSVTSAAIATVTESIQIRAGSVVIPLHDPLRVAEEWAVVDKYRMAESPSPLLLVGNQMILSSRHRTMRSVKRSCCAGLKPCAGSGEVKRCGAVMATESRLRWASCRVPSSTSYQFG
jgi:hypothetical protein